MGMADNVGTASADSTPIGQTPQPLTIRGWAQSDAGSGMYRIDLPLWALRNIGHEAVSVVGPDNVDACAESVDVVIGQTMADPERAERWHDLASRKERRPVLVAELDDDIWSVHGSNVAAAAFLTDEVRGRVEDTLRVADAVTVTTEHLARVASRFNENVYILPNCIDLSLLMHNKPEPQRRTIGWTVSSSHQMDVKDMAGTLSHFLRKHPEVDLHLVGQDFRDYFNVPNLRWTSWNAELNEYLRGLDFTVGIAPLLYHAFNKARSDIKALEYAALGIPIIASNFGPYPHTVVHGETGFLVKHPHEWAKYLNLLLNDRQQHQLMSINAKVWASNRTIQGNAWRWELAYRETIARVHGGEIIGLNSPIPPELLNA
jgi:glycosyltransferase involved in cell wall biosynthesis